MNNTLMTTALGLVLSGGLVAGPAEEIAKKHAEAQAAELETYLRENPEAEDKEEAVDFLLSSYRLTGNGRRQVELMRMQFDGIEAGEEVNPQQLFMSTRLLFDSLVNRGDKEGARDLIEKAKAKAAGHASAEALGQALDRMALALDRPMIGETMEIKFTSMDGREVDLAAMKGKVVLVDFWATWCGPCIAELPHVKKAYEKFHDEGFEVIGISLDKESDKEKLEAFVKENDMPWPQHFDGKGWKNDLAQKFNISSIPATYLIGPDGKIVATNLRGDELSKTVAKHLEK